MPLPLLLTLVVLGIAGIGLLLHLTGASRRFEITDAVLARREWARHWPQDTVHEVHLAGGGALVVTAQGMGLLRPFGADTVAHRVTRMQPGRGRRLRFAFDDFAAPPVYLALDDVTRAQWLALWSKADA